MDRGVGLSVEKFGGKRYVNAFHRSFESQTHYIWFLQGGKLDRQVGRWMPVTQEHLRGEKQI